MLEALLVPPPMSAERLGEAVAGLSGLVGFVVIPMFAAWTRLLLRMLETDPRTSLGRRRGVPTTALLQAMGVTLLFVFIVANWQSAGSELRELRREAAVVGPSLAGLGIGVLLWSIYAVALRVLRADYLRHRAARRMGRLL
ncbi:MAG: hypothetical protein ACPG4T_16335 [Nannocystaceae bacterium]